MYPPTTPFSSSLTYRTIVLALHYCTITIVLHVDRKRDHCHGNGHFHHNSPFCVLISTHHITSRLHGKYLLVSPLFPSPLMPSSSSCLPRASPTSSPAIPCTLIYPSLLIFPSPLPTLHPFLPFLSSLPLRLLLSCLLFHPPPIQLPTTALCLHPGRILWRVRKWRATVWPRCSPSCRTSPLRRAVVNTLLDMRV